MPFRKSTGEEKADVLLKVIDKGRANAKQAGVLLDVSYHAITDRVERGEIRAVKMMGPRYHISLRELIRLGIVLPTLPFAYHARLQQLLADDPFDGDSND